MNPTNNQTMTTNKNNDKAIKVAKPVKPSKSAPDNRKAKQASEGAKAVINAIAESAPTASVNEAKAAPTPKPKQTDATGKQEGKKREVTKPFDPTSKDWKPTCKFGTAMKRSKKWLSKWKSLKSDDERRGKYFSAALGFANRAVEKASTEVETNEAKAMLEEVTNA